MITYNWLKRCLFNSAYGAIGNNYFRYFDIRIAEAVTLAGQLSIRWIENKINEYMNRAFSTTDDYVIAVDTDSVYLKLDKLVNKFMPSKDVSKVIPFMDKVCEEQLIPKINLWYSQLAEYINAYEQKMNIKREVLCDKIIWVSKKHYILNVYDNEGVKYVKPKIKITGLDMIKSSTPSSVREKMKKAVNIIMQRSEKDLLDFIEDFRLEFKTLPVEEIAFPRTVNGLKKYKGETELYKKSTPVHVRGSLIYNAAIKNKHLEKQCIKIQEGEKIKFVYLKEPNPFQDNVIAFPVVLPKELETEKYIDRELQFEKGFIEPLKIILDTIQWKTKRVNTLDAFFK